MNSESIVGRKLLESDGGIVVIPFGLIIAIIVLVIVYCVAAKRRRERLDAEIAHAHQQQPQYGAQAYQYQTPTYAQGQPVHYAQPNTYGASQYQAVTVGQPNPSAPTPDGNVYAKV